MTALYVIVMVACGLGMLAGLVLLGQVLFARMSMAGKATALPVNEATGEGEPTLAALVLVPAHNEELGLGATLESVRRELRAGDRLLVVADNCNDRTAQVAADHGALVIERNHASHRGKGYALDFGARHIESWAVPPQVVIVIDADCRLGKGALLHMIRSVCETGRPTQALYLMHAVPTARLKVRTAEFAWIVKNLVRPKGMHAMGLPCPLMGSGMAFPWALFRAAPLASGDLVEDMKLGSDLAMQGFPPQFCEQAVVHSDFPAHEQGQQTQRRRWEQGHLSVIRRYGLRMLARGFVRLDPRQVAMALDLCIPPLAALVLFQCSTVLAAVALAALGRDGIPLAIAMVGMLSLTGAVGLAWHGWARHVIRGAELLSAPVYVSRKIPIYLSSAFGRPAAWIRTRRDKE